MRVSWTVERLDDLRDEVVRQGGRIDALGERIEKQTERIDSQGEWIDARIDALNQTILTIGGRLFAAAIAVVVAVVGLIATQL